MQYFFKKCYPDWFINKTKNKFDQRSDTYPEKYVKDYLFTVGISFFGKVLASFPNVFFLFKAKLHVDIMYIIEFR